MTEANIPPFQKHTPLWQVMGQFSTYARPYLGSILLSALLVLARVGVEVLRPWPLKLVIDNVLRGQPLRILLLEHLDRWQLLIASSALIIALSLGYALLAYLASSRITAIGQRMTFDIRKTLFRHVQRLPLAYYDRHRTGDMVTRIHSDISNVQDLLVAVVNVFLVNTLLIAGVILMMTTVDWHFTLISLTIAPALFLIARHYTLAIKTAQRRAKAKDGEIASLVQENVSLIRTVQAFAQEEHEAARFSVPATGARDAALRATELQARFEPLIEVITAVGTMMIVFYGARRVLLGEMSLGTMVVLMTYLQTLYSPVRQLAKMVNVTSKATVSAERVLELLNIEPEVPESEDATEAAAATPRLQGRIEFRNVSFSYPPRFGSTSERSVPLALNDITLEVEPGNTIAIVGKTGSGKTTLTNLLPRLYSPTRGSVLVDGQDLQSFNRKELRRQIALVPQDAALFRASIWENIAYGATDLPPGFSWKWLHDPANRKDAQALIKRVVHYAKEANAHEFISRLPEQYDTILGERGATLSGGQRQRIAIARAMIREAPILILDEPTTGLDASSEKLVMEALNRLKRGRTSFIVAHRLSTIHQADKIVVIEAGRIVEAGTHDELYQNGAEYRRFCDLQLSWG